MNGGRDCLLYKSLRWNGELVLQRNAFESLRERIVWGRGGEGKKGVKKGGAVDFKGTSNWALKNPKRRGKRV